MENNDMRAIAKAVENLTESDMMELRRFVSAVKRLEQETGREADDMDALRRLLIRQNDSS